MNGVGAPTETPFRWAVVIRSWAFVRPYSRLLVLWFSAVVAGSGLGVLPAWVLRTIINDLVARRNVSSINALILLLVAILVFSLAAQVVRPWLGTKIAASVTYDLRASLFDKLQRMPLSFFCGAQAGAIQTRILTDVQTAQALFTGNLANLLGTTFTFCFTVLSLAALSWQIALALLFGVPLVVVPTKWAGVRMRDLARTQMGLRGTLNSFTAERLNIAGATTVKLFGAYERESASFLDIAAKVRRIAIKQSICLAVMGAQVSAVTTLGAIMVYWFGVREVLSGAITVGTLAALITLLAQLYVPVSGLANIRVNVMTSLVAFERVFEVLDAPVAIADGPRSPSTRHTSRVS